MKNKDIHWVCDDCGRAANYVTCMKNFGAPPEKMKSDLSTFHLGKCDFCGRNRAVTEQRDYFYPDFVLLRKTLDKIK